MGLKRQGDIGALCIFFILDFKFTFTLFLTDICCTGSVHGERRATEDIRCRQEGLLPKSV